MIGSTINDGSKESILFFKKIVLESFCDKSFVKKEIKQKAIR